MPVVILNGEVFMFCKLCHYGFIKNFSLRFFAGALALLSTSSAAAYAPEKESSQAVSSTAYSAAGKRIFGDFELSADGTVLKKCLNKNIVNAVIPDGVKILENEAFLDCSKLQKLTIPNSVTKIGRKAFSGCHSLEVNIPDSVENICAGAFIGVKKVDFVNANYCYKMDSSGAILKRDSMGLIYVPGSVKNYKIPYGVTHIDAFAFSDCCKLKKLIIPITVGSIYDYAFERSGLSEVKIPDSVRKIGYGAFRDCKSLSKITIPEHLKSRSSSWGLSASCKIVVIPTQKTIKSGDYVLSEDRKTLIRCSNKKVKNAVVPNGVKIINEYAFVGCRDLTHVTLPRGLLEIQLAAFASCSSLKRLTIPNTVTVIGEYVFAHCMQLTVSVPANVKSIGRGAFIGVQQVILASRNKYYKRDSFGAILKKDGTELLYVPPHLQRYKIPYGVKIINAEAFSPAAYAENNLTEVKIPDTVQEIGDGAFSRCYKLKNVQVPFSVKNVENNSFSLRFLDEITIPAHLKSQFSKRKAHLKSQFSKRIGCKIKIAEKNNDNTGNSISSKATRSDSYGAILTIDNKKLIRVPKNIKSYRIPSGVTTIGYSAFRGCEKLTSITIPNSVTKIGTFAFIGCRSLKSVTIPAHLKSQFSKLKLPNGCKIKIAGE